MNALIAPVQQPLTPLNILDQLDIGPPTVAEITAAGLPTWHSMTTPPLPLQAPDVHTLEAIPIQKSRQRPRYTDWQKLMLAIYYSMVDSSEDLQWLCDNIGLSNRGKAHNMASRDELTRKFQTQSYDPGADWTLLDYREDPATTVFEETTDDHLRRTLNKRQTLAQIAFFRCHTEIALAYRARKLGLRKAARYWDLRYVSRWLNVSKSDLEAIGVKILPIANRRGRVGVYLVETHSLAAALSKNGMYQRLITHRDSDKFFIREVIESSVQVKQGVAEFESCPWISHAHTSLNAYCEGSFGMHYDGSDQYISQSFTPEKLDPKRVHLNPLI